MTMRLAWCDKATKRQLLAKNFYIVCLNGIASSRIGAPLLERRMRYSRSVTTYAPRLESRRRLRHASAISLHQVVPAIRNGVRMIPAVAVRDFVAAIGGTVAHRTILRDDQMAGAVTRPGASVSVDAPGSAGFMRLGQRQDAFDDWPVIVMGVVDWRLEHK
jgi:hypothetical protein